MTIAEKTVSPTAIPFRPIDMAGTGANIKRLREESGLSVRDLQEAFRFSTPQSIYKWQWGQSLPDVENLGHLARVLGVTVDEILVFKH